VAWTLTNLALLYWSQGRYGDAEALHKRALAIREQVLGESHPRVADSLNFLALVYWRQGKYSEAEGLYKRALAILEKALGANHRDVAWTLNGLALVYRDQGKYAEAEGLWPGCMADQRDWRPSGWGHAGLFCRRCYLIRHLRIRLCELRRLHHWTPQNICLSLVRFESRLW
jgi:tetratricopeptide (TPR) repeat protein